MTSLITLHNTTTSTLLLLLHLYCLLNYLSPPTLPPTLSPPFPPNSISSTLQTILLYYIPHLYPILFEILSLPYTSDSGKNMKFIKFKNPDVFSFAYALVAPITICHIWRAWRFCLGVWGWVGKWGFDVESGFGPGYKVGSLGMVVEWVLAVLVSIYVTVPCVLLMSNMLGNVTESLVEISTRYTGIRDADSSWDKLYWFRLKWGRTWGNNIFWWWESNPILLILKFKEEMDLIVRRPRYEYGGDAGRRGSLLPMVMVRSRTMLDINTVRLGKSLGDQRDRENYGSNFKRPSLGVSNSCLDLKKFYGGRPSLIQRCMTEKGVLPQVEVEGGRRDEEVEVEERRGSE